AEPVPVPSWLSGWILHAVILGTLRALDTEAVASAPELFARQVRPLAWGTYPLLESYTEGADRRCWQTRSLHPEVTSPASRVWARCGLRVPAAYPRRDIGGSKSVPRRV